MVEAKKIFEALIVLVIFVTIAPIALTAITGWNLTNYPVLEGVKDILAIVFVYGLGVFGIGKLVGII